MKYSQNLVWNTLNRETIERAEQWTQRALDELEVVYLWVDGVYVKAGLEKDKAALLVAVAGLSDGRKVFLALTPGDLGWADRGLSRRRGATLLEPSHRERSR